MGTLRRDEAHALVDAAYLGEAGISLRELAEHWDLAGYWSETVGREHWYMTLHEFVDECATGDGQRSNGPSDGDDTGLADL